MSFLTHNRHEELNYNEDFEESIARNKEDIDNDSETEGEKKVDNFTASFPYYFLFTTVIFLV